MQRIYIVALMVLIGTQSLAAVIPDDLEFKARLKAESGLFHMGEPIEIEISYSSQTENKYRGDFTSPSPAHGGVTLHVSPMDGVLDPSRLADYPGWAGSFLGSSGFLRTEPMTQQFELTEWYRFEKPGHYTVVITSSEVWRVKGAEEGGGKEPQILEASPVDFDILPADPGWVEQQINEINQALAKARDQGERASAIHRLALMDTPGSAERLVQLYLTSPSNGAEWEFDSALRESTQIDVIVPLLKNALSNPSMDIPSGLPEILATLQTRKELGLAPLAPSDPKSQQKWREELDERRRVHAKFLGQSDALLRTSLNQRIGPQKANAIYQIWWNAVEMNSITPLPADGLSRLESNVLAVADDLPLPSQVQFMTSAWQDMPHDQLLPLVRKISLYGLSHPESYPAHDAFERWCGERPDECNDAILQNVIRTKAKTDTTLILMLPEAEHPELDSMIKEFLKDSDLGKDWAQRQRTTALILRAGSRNILPEVESLINQSSGSQDCGDEGNGYLVGFLLRVDPKQGEKRLAEELRTAKDCCAGLLLRTLSQVHPSEDIIPVVVDTLNNPDPTVAGVAALYLGEHGPASSEDAIWNRLQVFWKMWQPRASELPDDITGTRHDPAGRAAMLEADLTSALTHSTNWTLGSAEKDLLRSSCLTQKCRDIADGKMSLGL